MQKVFTKERTVINCNIAQEHTSRSSKNLQYKVFVKISDLLCEINKGINQNLICQNITSGNTLSLYMCTCALCAVRSVLFVYVVCMVLYLYPKYQLLIFLETIIVIIVFTLHLQNFSVSAQNCT